MTLTYFLAILQHSVCAKYDQPSIVLEYSSFQVFHIKARWIYFKLSIEGSKVNYGSSFKQTWLAAGLLYFIPKFKFSCFKVVLILFEVSFQSFQSFRLVVVWNITYRYLVQFSKVIHKTWYWHISKSWLLHFVYVCNTWCTSL